MDNRKKNAITGIIVGLIGFILLFYFNFGNYGRWEFLPGYYPISFFGEITYKIIQNLNNGFMAKAQSDLWEYIGWSLQLISLGLVWYYRVCIGHWFYKIINKFYKKI